MKNQYSDPNIKNSLVEEDIPENEDISETDEETVETDDGFEHEYINPEDLDAVDPDDIALGEEYF